MKNTFIINILEFFSLGIFFFEINYTKASKDINLLDVNTLINEWDSNLDKNEKFVIGCFDSDNDYEYKNYIKAINEINKLETTQNLLSSKKYLTIFDAELINDFFQKNEFDNIYLEAPKIIVIRKDGLDNVINYEYSAERDFSDTSIKKFIIENSSEFMTDIENVYLINNNYYFIDFDNKASIYSMEKPFLYLNMKIIDKSAYTKDIFTILKQYRNQFNVIYTYQDNYKLPPFEYLKYSPLTIIHNNKKKGLEVAYDKNKFTESYIITFYNYIDNRIKGKYDLSYNNLVDFFHKYNNHTLIPQKPKMHFENQSNNKIIEYKFRDYVMELNLKNFVDVTSDVYKDVYVLIYYPWSEDYEKIKPIWNKLAKNLFNERNNIVLASYNVLDNEVLNTNFKNRNDYPEIVLYKSQINDTENNKKKVILYRREAGVSYESLASWISYSSTFNVIIPLNIDDLKSRIENQGYIGNNAENIFNKDKYLDYINNEHLAPKLDNEDLQEMRITSSYYSYHHKTAQAYPQPTYTSYKYPPPPPDPIPKAPENLFFKTLIFDDEAVLSIGIKIPYAEYPPKYIGAKEIKERVIRDDIKYEKKKKEAKKLVLNSKNSLLNEAKKLDNTLNPMNIISKQTLSNNTGNRKTVKLKEINNAKNVRLNEALGNSNESVAKHIKLNEAKNAKNIRLNEALGNPNESFAKNVKLNEAKNAKNIRLNEALGNSNESVAKHVKLNETKNAKNIRLNEALGNSNENIAKHVKLNEAKKINMDKSLKNLNKNDLKNIKLDKSINNDKMLKQLPSKNSIPPKKANINKRNISHAHLNSNNDLDNSILSTTIHLPNNN